MKDKRTREIALVAIFGALILLMSIVPAPWNLFTLPIGYLPTKPVEATIIHIPVIIGAIFGGKRVAIYLGLFFGMGSLITALLYAPITAPLFYNPLVSILPRVLFGYLIYVFFQFFSRIIKTSSVNMALTFAFSTLAHSLLVLSMIWVMGLFSYYTDVYTTIGNPSLFALYAGIISVNGLIEIVLAILIGTPIGLRVKEFKDLNKE